MSCPRSLSVEIKWVEPQNPYVGEAVSITFVINYPHISNEGDCVEYVLAVGDKTNIVRRERSYTGSGYGSLQTYFVVRFDNPGSYTLWVGAKYFDGCVERPVDYVWSDPVTVNVRPAEIPRVVRVVISGVSNTNPRVGETIIVRTTVYLSSPATGVYECLACAVYIDGLLKSVKRFRPQAGATVVECELPVTLTRPGTYNLCANALTFASSTCD